METSEDRAAALQAVQDAQKAIFHAMQQGSAPEWMHLDLTMGQLKALMALASQEGMNVSSLADALNVGKPAASILVDRLVQLGYAERTEDAEDRRRTLLAPTSAGQELVTSLRQGGSERFARWLEHMESGDLAALARGMHALAHVAERDLVHSSTLVS